MTETSQEDLAPVLTLKETFILAIHEGNFSENTSCMMMAQGEIESLDFTETIESFHYESAARLQKVFPRFFLTIQNAEYAVRQGQEYIANKVYCNRMGNAAFESGDGWRYRGRGIMMLTGKDNYIEYGRLSKLDLLNKPELLEDKENAAKVGILYFTNRPWLMKAAEAGDVLAASSYINLGSYKIGQTAVPNAYSERFASFQRYKRSGMFNQESIAFHL